MPRTLEAHDKLIREIFEGSYEFEIPDYQRPYAWTLEQAEELFDDLVAAMQDAGPSGTTSSQYFLGSIVLIKQDRQRPISKGTMSDVLDLEATLNILSDDSYILSYRHLLQFFAAKPEYAVSDVVCGAHMVYGWMPTILELGADSGESDLVDAASLLTKAKHEGALSDDELERLAKVTNNSLVGASKLLHFVAPESFAIWDSKIYAFVFREKPHNYRVQQVSKYKTYMAGLAIYQQDARFPAFHAAVNKKIGYAVSGLRALELVMFQHSPTIGSNQ